MHIKFDTGAALSCHFTRKELTMVKSIISYLFSIELCRRERFHVVFSLCATQKKICLLYWQHLIVVMEKSPLTVSKSLSFS